MGDGVKRLRFMLTMAGAIGLQGCATVTSQHLPAASDVAETDAEIDRIPAGDGLTYFLPQQLVRVTATRSGGAVEAAVKAYVKAQSELEEVQADKSKTELEILANERRVLDGAKDDAAKKILEARTAKLAAELDKNEADIKTKTKARDEAKDALKTAATAPTPADAGYKVVLKLEVQSPTSDPRQAFQLNPHHNIFRDDDQKITVRNGLLTSTDITASDRTADIVVELATAAGAAAATGKSDKDKDEAVEDPCKDRDLYIGVVDFVDGKAVKSLNDDLTCLGVKLEVSGPVWRPATRPVASTNTYYSAIGGVVYRTPVPVRVEIQKCATVGAACAETGKGWFTSEVIALSLPQAGPMAFLRQTAGLMTKSRYTLALSDGMLTDYSASRPSEVLEAARLPIRVLNGAADGVAKVISIRTGRANSEAALANARIAQLNAETGLKAAAVNGKRSLSEAELSALRADIALQAGAFEGQKTLSAAQLALLQQQDLLQVAPLEGDKSLSAAQLALLQQQGLLLAAGPNGQTALLNAQMAQVQAQAELTVAQNAANAQLSDSDLTTTRTILRNQYRAAVMNRCIVENTQAKLPIASCFDGF